MTTQIEEKAHAFLSRAERASGAEALAECRTELAEWSAYWSGREVEWRAAQPAAAQEAAQARGLLADFIAPALDRLAQFPIQEQGRFINLMVPFEADGGLRDFLLHFFQFAVGPDEKLIYQERDPFERELFILHDLYKVKKTLEVTAIIREAGRNPESRFPSRFSPDQQLSILNRLEEVLSLMFSQTLPTQHRQEIRDSISPDYLSAAQLLWRREQNLLFTFPHVLERYDYRRFYFLIYFKEGLKARFESEERSYRYHFLHFQWLKREYLAHWLEQRLKGNANKFKMYAQYQVRGKSLLELVSLYPEQEMELLMEMSTPDFHAMVGEIDEQLPSGQKIGFDAETERFGLYHRLKAQLREAAELAKAPLETLRQFVTNAAPKPAPQPAAPAPPTVPAEIPPAPAPRAAAPAEPSWQLTLLDKSRIALPFLTPLAQGFNTQLAAVKTTMGLGYEDFSQFAEKLLDNSPEISQVRRQTPKHEWTMPYQIRHISPEGTRYYLLVIGAEVKARPRGMGYQAKEAYNFTPYFVFAAAETEQDFGTPGAERKANGRAFYEYTISQPAVWTRASEVISAVRERVKV